ncbi:MAG: MerC domain-containing protein [Saprospiraceae bacterium]|nr:MerC domain-containing protein [Saprospiraceae bacterium]
MTNSIISKKSDLLGIFASGLCAVHCAITPLFFAAKPLFDHATSHHHHGAGPWGWAMLDYIFLVLSLLAVWVSTRHTNSRPIKTALWASWVCFAGGLALEIQDMALGKWLMYGGSIALIVAHIINLRHCRACEKTIGCELR